jgi:hypothetical protein
MRASLAAVLSALAATGALMGTLTGCAGEGARPLYGLVGAAPPPAAASAAAAAPTAPGRADAVLAARRCGTTLGIAARCNFLRDDTDFAILRYAVLGSLNGKYVGAASPAEIEEALDLATLDRLTSIGTCTVPPADAARVEAGMRTSVDACVRP